jgi:hypothetical protein
LRETTESQSLAYWLGLTNVNALLKVLRKTVEVRPRDGTFEFRGVHRGVPLTAIVRALGGRS